MAAWVAWLVLPLMKMSAKAQRRSSSRTVQTVLLIAGDEQPQSVTLVVAPIDEDAGYDPADFSGHSLRVAFLTVAAHARASLSKAQEVGAL